MAGKSSIIEHSGTETTGNSFGNLFVAGSSAVEQHVAVYDDRQRDGSERRRSTREAMVTRGTLRAVMGLQNDPALEVLVVDVSLHGVGLRSAESLQVGDLYQVEIGAGSALLGRTLHDAAIRRTTGALLLALRCPDGPFLANPDPNTPIEAHSVLIVLGTTGQLTAVRRRAGAT